ncbi:helix-turn-helix transcriptional regulator [Streptomyces sp. NPDC005485]|uniref:helix-turn-helix transcriptional regulator n=1 Tax=Streptomyces sp. NPDC005485 TaxID=3155591 RepID=UPI0033ABC23E
MTLLQRRWRLVFGLFECWCAPATTAVWADEIDVVSAALISAGEWFAFWREVNARLWVPCDPGMESGLPAEASISGFGPVQATLMTAIPPPAHRPPRPVRQADPRAFKPGCFVRGAGPLAQPGRHAEPGVEDLALFDIPGLQVAKHAPESPLSQTLLLRFPRFLLPLPARDPRWPGTARIPGAQGIGALSPHCLPLVAWQLHGPSPSATARLSAPAPDAPATASAGVPDASSTVAPPTRRRALMTRIHAFIADNLGDAHLTPDAIATAHHISLRYLHKLFKQEGHTVAGWVRACRLEQCRRDLADPQSAARPIHAIAARWGFASPAHFSQVFRGAYGLSPSQFRRQRTAVRPD